MRQKSRRIHALCPYLCVPILLLAVLPAWGAPGRGVYVNGLVHKPYMTSGLTGYIALDQGTRDWSSGYFKVSNTVKSSYNVCRSSVTNPAEGVAVFYNQIFYAYGADKPASATPTTSCGGPGGTYAWVATFDLTKNQWISNRAVGPLQGRANSGTAIAVFDGQLYLFTDNGTYTSGDGVAWAGPQTGLMGSTYEPQDAVTIDPVDAEERILIVYSDPYGDLESASWNGQAGTASNTVIDHMTRQSDIPSNTYAKGLSLLRGTRTLALNTPPPGGAKAPTVQLFGMFNYSAGGFAEENMEYRYDTSPPTWSGPGQINAGAALSNMFVFPWYQANCKGDPSLQALQQYLIVNGLNSTGGNYCLNTYASDNMVPKNQGVPMTACGDYGGTGTDTGAEDPNDPNALAIRQHYWTMVGVVMGSPPFALNGIANNPVEYEPLSNVEYGKGSGYEVEQTNEMSNESVFSAGMEVRAGLEKRSHVTGSFDLGYKLAWESAQGKKSTAEMKYTKTMGSEDSVYNELGKWGWALFNVPVMVVQDWAIYAYDYNSSTGAGTALNQDLQTISAKKDSSYMQQVAFELANPGGPNDSYPGLLAGMGPFAPSTDLNFWSAPKSPTGTAWNWQDDSRWNTKFGSGTTGDQKVQPLTWTAASGSDQDFASTQESMTSSGHSVDVDFTAGLEMTQQSKLEGFKFNVTAGYEGSYKSDTTETTGFGTQVGSGLHMKSCEAPEPGCVTNLTVQPYWLQATDPTAPWVPTAYTTQLPWAMTWKITAKTVVQGIGSSAAAGTAPAPLNASGRIVSGKGGGEGGVPNSHYSLEGGRLVWVDANGVETRIPMTADQFVPSRGVSFEVHSFSWSSVGEKGSWTRSGNVWTFQPDGSVRQNRVSLKLDFGNATYDLQIERADLAGGVLAGFPNTQLTLVVNNQYRFDTVLRHDIDIAWRWSQPPANHDTLQVASLQGRYNSAKGSGKMSMSGILPAQLPVFGDMGLEINGRQVIVPLVTMDHFAEALESGDVLRYEEDGMTLVVDFGEKTWSATFNEKAFNTLLAPRLGKMRERVFVGGNPWFKGEHAVVDFSTNLKLSR